jgi:hypothetical protein
MWQTFWGGDMQRLSPSNRRAVVPGGWRLEVSPVDPAREDEFLHALEIGDAGSEGRRVQEVVGHRLAGAVVEGDAAVLFLAEGAVEAEVTLPDLATGEVEIAGLRARETYELQFTSGFAPGSPLWRHVGRVGDAGLLRVPWTQKDGRLRLRQAVPPREEKP